MKHKKPFFSIVMPTRNRAHLLRHALQSALDQTFDDYEIIVSDNCSQDDTVRAVKELATSRVRYVRPNRPLSMPDHWEFALDYAQGRYITYLCDDDALYPEALERVANTISEYGSELLVLGSAIYYGDNWLNAEYRNCMEVPAYTGRTRECDSRDTLVQLSTCGDTYDAPRMQNSFCCQDVISRLRAEYRKIFFLVPDYSFAAFVLTAVPKWIYIDEPLRLQGVFAEGIGSTTLYNRGKPAQEFIREFDRSNLFERVPLKAPVTTNFIAESILMVKERVGSKLADFDINWEQYFITYWKRIWIHEMTGVKVESDKEEFFRVLARQPEKLRSRVLTAIKDPAAAHPLKRAARKIINSLPLLDRLKSVILRRKKEIPPVIIYGNEAGFSNILECARQLKALLP